MSDIFTPTSSTLEVEKDARYKRIYELCEAYEMEMHDYIKKYVLNGRSLTEVFSLAHQSVVAEVNEQGCVYGHYVLRHIIRNEDVFSTDKQCSEGMFNSDFFSNRNYH